MKAVKLTISGKVQGVGYRHWFAQYAVALGLKGLCTEPSFRCS